jgi:hypothetical protein
MKMIGYLIYICEFFVSYILICSIEKKVFLFQMVLLWCDFASRHSNGVLFLCLKLLNGSYFCSLCHANLTMSNIENTQLPKAS